MLMEIQLDLQRRTGRVIDLDELKLPVMFESIVELLGVDAAVAVPSDADPDVPEIQIEVTNSRWSASRDQAGMSTLEGIENPNPPSLPEQVRTSARKHPDRIAVREDGATLTYRELVQSAEVLARRILNSGEGMRGGIVIVKCDPGIDYCIAVLAAVTAGCFAAPLHPDIPVARAERIVELSKPRLILSDSSGADWFQGIQKLPIDRVSRPEPNDLVGDVPSTDLDDPCYVLFTSGSTGDPKGARVHQLPVANLARFEAERLGHSAGIRTAQFAPLGFDIAIQELFGTFASAGELVVVPMGVRRDPLRLVRFLVENRVTRLYCVPLLLRLIARAALAVESSLPDLKEIVTCGEPLLIDEQIRCFATRCEGVSIANQFGLAEAIQATHADLGDRPEKWEDVPEIGGPIPGVRIRVTDENGTVLPRGREGEIEIGGRATGLGYLDPQQEVRFHDEDGCRWLRTGDRGTIASTGRLDFRGRRDNQVKIRGFRIELGDVEHAIRSLDPVDEAVVVPVDRAVGDRRLLALVIVHREVSEVSILEQLARLLPPWMVPQELRFVDSIPISGNGKVDRQAAKNQFAERPSPAETS